MILTKHVISVQATTAIRNQQHTHFDFWWPIGNFTSTIIQQLRRYFDSPPPITTTKMINKTASTNATMDKKFRTCSVINREYYFVLCKWEMLHNLSSWLLLCMIINKIISSRGFTWCVLRILIFSSRTFVRWDSFTWMDWNWFLQNWNNFGHLKNA